VFKIISIFTEFYYWTTSCVTYYNGRASFIATKLKNGWVENLNFNLKWSCAVALPAAAVVGNRSEAAGEVRHRTYEYFRFCSVIFINPVISGKKKKSRLRCSLMLHWWLLIDEWRRKTARDVNSRSASHQTPAAVSQRRRWRCWWRSPRADQRTNVKLLR